MLLMFLYIKSFPVHAQWFFWSNLKCLPEGQILISTLHKVIFPVKVPQPQLLFLLLLWVIYNCDEINPMIILRVNIFHCVSLALPLVFPYECWFYMVYVVFCREMVYERVESFNGWICLIKKCEMQMWSDSTKNIEFSLLLAYSSSSFDVPYGTLHATR